MNKANANSIWSREHLLAVVLTVVLTFSFVALVMLSGGKTSLIMLFPLAAVLLFLLSRFELALAALIVSLFVNFNLGNVLGYGGLLAYSSAVLFSLLFGVSFLLSHRDFKWKEFANPMTVPILIYGACIVPSFLNATQPLLGFLKLVNVAAFLIVMYVLVGSLRTNADLRRVVRLYLMITVLNSLVVFVQSWLGSRRPFGFTGIMFVDYAGLGTCVAAALSVSMRGKSRIFFLSVSATMAVALLLTLTRTIWIATLVTLGILLVYVAFNPEVAGLSRKRVIVLSVTGLLSFGIVVSVAISLNPAIEARGIEIVDDPSYGFTETGLVNNSLGARMLIWDTALSAFQANPYFGIGVYSFPYTSQYYYRIPKIYYERFVARLSPHQTHLAVLAETGILGAIGFVLFLVSAVRCAFKAITTAKSEVSRRNAFVAGIALVYCLVSMVVTDAWMWGQGIVLLGIVLGLMLANRKFSISIPDSSPVV